MVPVPIVGDVDHPEGRTLADANGLPIVHVERDGRVIADLLELDVPVERALPYVLEGLQGMCVAGLEDLGRALVARGARLHRHDPPCCRRSRLPATGLANVDDRIVAAILVGTIPDAPPPFGGPWIMEVFSIARGAGRALLQRALHRSEGSLGLAVTEDNPAIRVYESLGFRRTPTAYSVDL
jgi:GNAT superfamily N-acetyltransferase